jgi:uncharacterized protein (TIGR02145 family)
MKAQFSKLALAAALGLALTFTLSCSSDNDNGGGSSPPIGGSSSSGVGNSSSGGNLGGSSSSSVGNSSSGGNLGGSSSSGVGNSSSGGNLGGSSSSIGGVSSSSVGNVVSSSSNGGDGSCTAGINGTFVDSRDNKSYKTVKICDQTWLAENLNYRGTEPDTLGRCYGDDPANCTTYGRLYDWATAMGFPLKCNYALSTSDTDCAIHTPHQGICPSGWHIPSIADWDELMTAVGGIETAGKYLKATNGWNENGNGNDKFGFAALPGGKDFTSSGMFGDASYRGYWWSATESDAFGTYYLIMYWNDEKVNRSGTSKSSLHSVRCIKN